MKKTTLELLQKRLKELNSQSYSSWKMNSYLQDSIKGEIKGVRYAIMLLRKEIENETK